MPDISGLDFITLLVTDLAASHHFYTDKLGLAESEKRPNGYSFETKPCGLAIRQSSEARSAAASTQGIILWLHTTDSRALHAELKTRGVPIAGDLKESPFGMTFSFKDPDGYVWSVYDMA